MPHKLNSDYLAQFPGLEIYKAEGQLITLTYMCT